MMKLVDKLQYRNLIFGSREELSEILGVTPGNVRRTLKKVESMIEVTELKKGHYKIEVSPAYGFRWFGGVQRVQKDAILTWYRPSEALEKILTPNNNYIEYLNDDFNKNHHEYSPQTRESLKLSDKEREMIRKKWLEKDKTNLKYQHKTWLSYIYSGEVVLKAA